MSPKGRGGRRPFPKIALALLSAAAACAGIEAVYRRLHGPGQDVFTYMHLQPYTMFGDHRHPAALPEDRTKYRICMLGGSTVASGDPPLPALVERALEKRGVRDAEVLNFGVVSQNSSQELARIVFHVADLRPDLVVMYNGGNDIMSPFFADPRPGHPFNFMVWENNVFLQAPGRYPLALLAAFASAFARVNFPRFFREKICRFSSLRRAAGFGTEPWREEIASIYVRNLVKADAVARAFGAEFEAFFQPLAAYGREPHTGEDVHAWRTRELVRRELALARTRRGLRVHDLSDLFAGAPDAFKGDFIHVKPWANEKVAAAVAGRMVETLRRRRRRPV